MARHGGQSSERKRAARRSTFSARQRKQLNRNSQAWREWQESIRRLRDQGNDGGFEGSR